MSILNRPIVQMSNCPIVQLSRWKPCWWPTVLSPPSSSPSLPLPLLSLLYFEDRSKPPWRCCLFFSWNDIKYDVSHVLDYIVYNLWITFWLSRFWFAVEVEEGSLKAQLVREIRRFFLQSTKNTFLFIWKRTKMHIYSEKKLNSLLSFELHPNLRKLDV